MYLIKAIIITSLLTSFFDALLSKWGLYAYFEETAAKGRIRLIYDLATCRFCCRFWLAVLMAVFYGFTWDFDLELLLVPFLVAGVFNFVRV